MRGGKPHLLLAVNYLVEHANVLTLLSEPSAVVVSIGPPSIGVVPFLEIVSHGQPVLDATNVSSLLSSTLGENGCRMGDLFIRD
jgi:hypothetical protein